MENKIREFCEKAIEVWGEDSQLRMCIEEMSELTKEICKYQRLLRSEGIDDIEEKLVQTRKNIIEETADVLNCAEQMALIFGEEEVAKVRMQKIERASKCLKK